MALEFRLPDIGEGLTEAEIVRWLIEVGEWVAPDQPLVEVETDKAVVDIPAPRGGVVLHHGAKAGETLRVGAILAVIGEEGEYWSPTEGSDAAPIVGTLAESAEQLPARPEAPPGQAEEVPTPTEEPASGPVEPAPAPPDRPHALPLVRKLAKELAVELTTLTGTGPGGRITREDVLGAAERGAEEEPVPRFELPPFETVEPAPAAPPIAAGGRVRLSKLRRTIAERMERSWREIPHVTTFDQVDGTRLLAARSALARRHGRSIPLEALVGKAVIPALQAHPEFNASLEDEELVVHAGYDLGFAVDTPDGLVVAVAREADRLGVVELADEVGRLAEAARARTLDPAELTGYTFTISNIGAVGGGFGTPIIPLGTTAILSVGMAREQPVAREGKVEVAPLIPLSLSYDHRVIDGGLGRRFMALVIENLEEPALFMAG